MVFLEEFGFRIYRLKEATREKEFLIYDIEKNEANQYSKSRLFEILLMELDEKKIPWRKFAPDNNSPINWLKSQMEIEIKLVNGIGFKPINEVIIEEDNKKYINLFKCPETFKTDHYKLDSPMCFDEFKTLAPYHYKLLMNLHNKDELAVQDTLLKIADKIRYPYLKSQDCIIFYPAEGAGKGIFHKYILEAIAGQYTNKVLMKKLNSDFNSFLEKSLFLTLEEGKRDLELVETLKEAITESRMLINQKGVDATEKPVYFLTFVFSNHMNPIDLGKRRGSYHRASALGKTNEESQAIGRELCENLPNETEVLLKYLHNLEFTHQQALEAFNTIAKVQVNELNKNPLELFYDTLLSYPSLKSAIFDLHEKRFGAGCKPINLETIKKKGVDYISKELLKDTYNNFCVLEGFKTNLIRHNKDIVQLWALFDIPDDSHKRIMISEGSQAGRKLDHLRYNDINDKILEAYKDADN